MLTYLNQKYRISIVKSMKSFILKLILIFILIFSAVFLSAFYLNQVKNNEKTYPQEPELSVGILSIALGKYNIFWKKFYESSEKYFLPNAKKEYFLFTDDENIPYKNNENVHYIYHENMGWPYNTLMRFDLFLSQKEELKKFDYLFFFNINLEFKDFVGDEVLPKGENDGLVIVFHPGFYKKTKDKFTYERNPASTAYIPMDEGRFYASGAFIGGTSDAFLKLSEVCRDNIQTDLDNDFIAEWHDESHLNKYLLGKNPLILPISYLWPEEDNNFHDPVYENNIKAILRDKMKYGGRRWLRGSSDIKSTPFNRLKYKILSKIAPTQEKRDEYKEIEDYLTLFWVH